MVEPTTDVIRAPGLTGPSRTGFVPVLACWCWRRHGRIEILQFSLQSFSQRFLAATFMCRCVEFLCRCLPWVVCRTLKRWRLKLKLSGSLWGRSWRMLNSSLVFLYLNRRHQRRRPVCRRIVTIFVEMHIRLWYKSWCRSPKWPSFYKSPFIFFPPPETLFIFSI